MVVPDGATPQLGEASTVSLDIDPAADDFVWQKGYAWCLTTPEAASGCAVSMAPAAPHGKPRCRINTPVTRAQVLPRGQELEGTG